MSLFEPLPPPTPGQFEFGDGGVHNIGDKDCPECWKGYPKPCDNGDCPGLIHAHFGDEDMDCNYWLHTACDVCGMAE